MFLFRLLVTLLRRWTQPMLPILVPSLKRAIFRLFLWNQVKKKKHLNQLNKFCQRHHWNFFYKKIGQEKRSKASLWPYPHTSKKTNSFSRELMLFIIRGMHCPSIVDNPHFIRFVRHLDPRITIPCRRTITQSSAGNLQWNCQQTETGTTSDSMGSSYFWWMNLTEKPSLYHFDRPLQKFSHENDITGFEHWTHRRVRH